MAHAPSGAILPLGLRYRINLLRVRPEPSAQLRARMGGEECEQWVETMRRVDHTGPPGEPDDIAAAVDSRASDDVSRMTAEGPSVNGAFPME